MCSYREKKSEPQELLQLDGYTVDYSDPQPGEASFIGSYVKQAGAPGTDNVSLAALSPQAWTAVGRSSTP